MLFAKSRLDLGNERDDVPDEHICEFEEFGFLRTGRNPGRPALPRAA